MPYHYILNYKIINFNSFDNKIKKWKREPSLFPPLIRFHDLRHSHASLLLKENVPAKVISERLGHSNTNITLNLYSHIYEETNMEVANTFEKFLKLG